MKDKFYILILLVVILISGCATPRMYEGPKLPKEQVAIIKGDHSPKLLFAPAIFIRSSYVGFLGTDGNAFKPIYLQPGGYPSKIEVLPGYHKVIVLLHKEAFRGYAGPIYERNKAISLEFYAEAGHDYLIKVPRWWKEGSPITVVDVGSGEVVASETIK